MSNRMTNAVEAAYRVFAPYRVGKRLSVCNCPVCMTEEDEVLLATTPLRQIPARLIAEYTNSAHETLPGSIEADEFRYFLPRYLDLMAAGEAPCHMGFEICLRRVERSEFRRAWPAEEIAVIDDFLDAFMAQRFSDIAMTSWRREPGGPKTYDLAASTDDTLTCLVTAGCDLPRVLAVWDALPDPEAAVRMADARGRVLWTAGRYVFENAHLQPNFVDEAVAIAAFLTRPQVLDRIEAAFLAATDEGLEQILEKGIW